MLRTMKIVLRTIKFDFSASLKLSFTGKVIPEFCMIMVKKVYQVVFYFILPCILLD